MAIEKIIIHCAATQNGVRLAKRGKSAAQIIDNWHFDAHFRREINNKIAFNRHLHAIGYHFVIDTNGMVESGRKVGETGAHCRGQNRNSVGICLIGTDRFTTAQWQALANLVRDLSRKYPNATLHGHREFAAKICPGFDVAEWIDNDYQPIIDNTIMELEYE